MDWNVHGVTPLSLWNLFKSSSYSSSTAFTIWSLISREKANILVVFVICCFVMFLYRPLWMILQQVISRQSPLVYFAWGDSRNASSRGVKWSQWQDGGGPLKEISNVTHIQSETVWQGAVTKNLKECQLFQKNIPELLFSETLVSFFSYEGWLVQVGRELERGLSRLHQQRKNHIQRRKLWNSQMKQLVVLLTVFCFGVLAQTGFFNEFEILITFTEVTVRTNCGDVVGKYNDGWIRSSHCSLIRTSTFRVSWNSIRSTTGRWFTLATNTIFGTSKKVRFDQLISFARCWNGTYQAFEYQLMCTQVCIELLTRSKPIRIWVVLSMDPKIVCSWTFGLLFLQIVMYW